MTTKTYGDSRCYANYFWSDLENGCVDYPDEDVQDIFPYQFETAATDSYDSDELNGKNVEPEQHRLGNTECVNVDFVPICQLPRRVYAAPNYQGLMRRGSHSTRNWPVLLNTLTFHQCVQTCMCSRQHTTNTDPSVEK
ncbi:uncharacterized protein LOC130046506 isoform X2 [Ostrea edulis]|uniref:uncharacterized protein LOC130046506 isoform X2 n=1 Tax=Ostrea edulis TaxID=37623 RepID=UPI0024AE886E|nr:uncharacterized protein LOC130046506 isoform X2 [Ostrea edulis]